MASNEKMRPCIDFLITQKCNYRCPYCSQSKKFLKNVKEASNETIDAFLALIKTVGKDFEITISGGEPLTHPRFYEVLEEIKRQNLKLTVISNFSFPLSDYKKIADIMGENLLELFVSFHESQVKDINGFLEKAKEFSEYKNPKTAFSVASVLSDENVSTLEKVQKFLFKNNIKFNLQHMRIKNSYVKYSKKAADFLAKNAVPEAGRSLKTFGKMCHAGEKFLLIYENGEAYRCYSSRFNKAHSLGNIKDKNFKMLNGPMPCLNRKCTCPKPVSFGMLDLTKSDNLRAAGLLVKNVIFLPALIMKNLNVIKAKFSQGFALKK